MKFKAQDDIENNLEDSPKQEDKADFEKAIKELEQKVNQMNIELIQLKNKRGIENWLDDTDLNDSVMQNGSKKAYLKKKAFLQVMDELDKLAEYFSAIDSSITIKIDNIADKLRSYDKV